MADRGNIALTHSGIKEELDMGTPAIMYGHDGQEHLTAITFDEAVAEQLEDHALQVEVTVITFQRKTVDPNHFTVLEGLLEDMADDYGDREGDFDPFTAEGEAIVNAAEAAFVAAVVREYRPWQCEEIAREVVNVEAWTRGRLRSAPVPRPATKAF